MSSSPASSPPQRQGQQLELSECYDYDQSGRREKTVIRCRFPECGYKTEKNSNFKRHFETMHKILEPPLTCCDLSFLTKGEYRQHTRSSHSDGHVCPQCFKVFNRKALLERHSAVHTGKKPFKCSYCGYSSANKANVTRHLSIHLTSTPTPTPTSSSCDNDSFTSTDTSTSPQDEDDISPKSTKRPLRHSIESILSSVEINHSSPAAALPSRKSQEINSSHFSSPQSSSPSAFTSNLSSNSFSSPPPTPKCEGLALQLQQIVQIYPHPLLPHPLLPHPLYSYPYFNYSQEDSRHYHQQVPHPGFLRQEASSAPAITTTSTVPLTEELRAPTNPFAFMNRNGTSIDTSLKREASSVLDNYIPKKLRLSKKFSL